MRRRLVLLSLATTTMVVLAFLLPLGLLVRQLAESRAVDPARQTAQSLAPLVGLGSPESVAAAVDAAARRTPGEVWVLAPDGRTYGTAVTDAPLPTVTSVTRLSDGGRLATVPIVADAGTGVVAISVPAELVSRGVAQAWGILGALGLLLIGAAALVTDRLARSTTTSIEDIEETARRLSSGDLSARTSAVDPPEVVRVARALDLLAERISDLLASEREAAADLSHRLRTPLAALRLDLEALPPGRERDTVADDLDALEAAVTRAIDDARRPARGGATKRCDLAGVLRARVAWWRALADEEARSLALEVDDGPAWVAMSRADAEVMVDALLGNVFAHTGTGVGARVSLRGDLAEWTMLVEDDGPGFPAGIDVVARGVSPGGSTGLGLDIIARTVQGAGGVLELESGRTSGARVACRFPRVEGPA